MIILHFKITEKVALTIAKMLGAEFSLLPPLLVFIYGHSTPAKCRVVYLWKASTFGFNSGPLRALGAGPCRSGIEQTLLRKVIGSQSHLWRFPWALADCGTLPLISIGITKRRDVPASARTLTFPFPWQKNPYPIKLPSPISSRHLHRCGSTPKEEDYSLHLSGPGCSEDAVLNMIELSSTQGCIRGYIHDCTSRL